MFTRNNEAFSSWKLCDVGCGVGEWPLFLARVGISAVGIDFTQEMVRLAHTRTHKKIPFLVMSASKMGFPNASFDILTSLTVLQHISNERELNLAVAEMSRVVKPEGYVLILESSPLKKSKKEEFDWIRIRTRDEYVDLFMRNGLIVVSEMRVCRFFGLKALAFVEICRKILRTPGFNWKINHVKRLLLKVVFPLDVSFSRCPILKKFYLIGVLLFEKRVTVEKQGYGDVALGVR